MDHFSSTTIVYHRYHLPKLNYTICTGGKDTLDGQAAPWLFQVFACVDLSHFNALTVVDDEIVVSAHYVKVIFVCAVWPNAQPNDLEKHMSLLRGLPREQLAKLFPTARSLANALDFMSRIVSKEKRGNNF